MALKITKEIGTNRGITSEAYIRIYNYQISKSGHLQLNIQMFMNQESANVPFDQIVSGMECFNSDIQNMVRVPLMKTLKRTVTKTVMVEEDQEVKVPKYENGALTDEYTTEIKTVKTPKEMEVEEEYQVPDLSQIEGVDIFAFGYESLKAKLQEKFGAENIVDC